MSMAFKYYHTAKSGMSMKYENIYIEGVMKGEIGFSIESD